MYASQENMVQRFGQREVIALTDREHLGQINAAVLAGGLTEAGVEIDAYLAGRYAVPLETVPSLLVGVACDIARYRLCGGEVITTEEIRIRYRDAIKLLEKIGKGDLSLGGMPSGKPAPTVSSIQFVSAGKVFGRDAL